MVRNFWSTLYILFSLAKSSLEEMGPILLSCCWPHLVAPIRVVQEAGEPPGISLAKKNKMFDFFFFLIYN